MKIETEAPIAKQNSIASCTLPYPERFQAAVVYVEHLGEDSDLSEETKLLLYSLKQQATVGPCNEPRPWGWNVVSNAKWQSWRQLGDMSNTEAMRLYVRTLEEEEADWWSAELAASWKQLKEGDDHSSDDTGSSSADETSETVGSGSGGGGATKDTPSNGTTTTAAAAAKAKAKPADAKTKPSATTFTSPKSRSVAEVVVEGSWVSPYIASDKRPPPRYEHAATLVNNQLFIIGGNCGGRYLSDVWSLNLENLSWTTVYSGGSKKQPQREKQRDSDDDDDDDDESSAPLLTNYLPPVAGHTLVPWNGNIVCIGGHSKLYDAPAEIPVRLLDTSTSTWSVLEPSVAEEGEDAPRPRGGHSATLIGNKVYVFGGEDPRRKLFNELWTLDLTTLEWSKPETSGPVPCARSAHTAVQYRNRHIVIFGGGSVASCYDDLFVLDTQTLTWSQPEVQGLVPPPRAGHAAAVLGHIMYAVGGGNNNSGCADMYAMDLSTLDSDVLEWILVGNTPSDSAIAAEGLSLLSVPMAGCLISFGGYNGRYHNALHVYRPEGYVVVKSGPAGVSANGAASAPPGKSTTGNTTTTTAAKGATGGPTTNNTANKGGDPSSISSSEYKKAMSDLEAAKREALSAKETVQHEVAIMRRQLDGATSALAEAESTLEATREALATEQAKNMRLEVEVAELKQALAEKEGLERELARYRQREEQEGQKKSGLWSYISGSDAVKS